MSEAHVQVLKDDALGRVERVVRGDVVVVRRVACGGRVPGSRWLARRLLERERRALARLATLDGVPRLLATDGASTPRGPVDAGSIETRSVELERTYLDGRPLSQAEALPVDFFDALDALVARLHAAGVCHNDLHKEQNVLVRADGRPALVDFQLASVHARPTRRFRLRARDDLRHVQKHRRRYLRPGRGPDLAEPELERLRRGAGHGLRRTPLAWLWRRLGKPVYVVVTRRVLGTRDGEARRPSSGPWPRWTPAVGAGGDAARGAGTGAPDGLPEGPPDGPTPPVRPGAPIASGGADPKVSPR